MTTNINTPPEVLTLFIKQAERDGYAAAAMGSLTECARADNTFRTWANDLRAERGRDVYRAVVTAYVDGKRAGAAAWARTESAKS